MADTQGAVCKLCRREGIKLFLKGDRCFTPKCAVDPNRRPYPPGPHQQRRRKASEYSLQLREKQKVRHIYGVLERQFRRHYAEADREAGATGDNLLSILESRLDNVVFRMGLADSRPQARQLVVHGHLTINGRKASAPSQLLSAGDVVAVSDRAKSLEYFKVVAEEIARKQVPEWLVLDVAALTGRVLREPTRTDLQDVTVQEQLVVEYYSR